MFLYNIHISFFVPFKNFNCIIAIIFPHYKSLPWPIKFTRIIFIRANLTKLVLILKGEAQKLGLFCSLLVLSYFMIF